jgi:transposase
MEKELKKDIVRQHLAEGRTIRSLAEEHGVSKASISNWVKEYREECQENKVDEKDSVLMRDNLRLRKELAESQKEVAFLKKAAAFFAKEID